MSSIRAGHTLRLLFFVALLPICAVGSFAVGWQEGYAAGASDYGQMHSELVDQVSKLGIELDKKDRQIEELSNRIAALEMKH